TQLDVFFVARDREREVKVPDFELEEGIGERRLRDLLRATELPQPAIDLEALQVRDRRRGFVRLLEQPAAVGSAINRDARIVVRGQREQVALCQHGLAAVLGNRHHLRRRHVDELELLLYLAERDPGAAFQPIFLAGLDARPFEVRPVAAPEVLELPARVRPAHDRVLRGHVAFGEPQRRRRSTPDEVFRLEEKNAARRDFANRTHGHPAISAPNSREYRYSRSASRSSAARSGRPSLRISPSIRSSPATAHPCRCSKYQASTSPLSSPTRSGVVSLSPRAARARS